MPPPSHTNRRFSVRAAAVYLFPLIAFDGGIINHCDEFVKGFGEFSSKKLGMGAGMDEEQWIMRYGER